MIRFLNLLKFEIYNSSKFRLAFVALIFILASIVYLPGASGPFIFDDYPNITSNESLRMERLNLEGLQQAAQSTVNKRPLAYVSFALNGYFAGGFSDSTPFKLTNILIHLANALLITWMLHIILRRVSIFAPEETTSGDRNDLVTLFLAASIGLIWLVHPIQVTSVLYVVQRMTSLSSTFIILGILSYLIGRQRLISGGNFRFTFLLGGPLVFGLIGLQIKEIAALLPLYIVLLEAILFRNEKPWNYWTKLSRRDRQRFIVTGAIALIPIVIFSAFWVTTNYLPGYSGRSFTLTERLLTQPRALLYYISLIILPRSNEFGIHHDDFVTSVDITTPWTTLPSIIALLSAVVFAAYFRSKRPVLSLGLLWFVSGHLLESTVFPLEMVHEHRNYLASIGIILILAHTIYAGSARLKNKRVLMLIPATIILFGGLTFARAGQWSSYELLVAYNAHHHPRSARAQLELGGLYATQKKFDEARQAFRSAIKLQPRDPSLLIGLQMIDANQGAVPDSRIDEQITRLIRKYPLNSTFFWTIKNVAECVQTNCKSLNRSLELWSRTTLANIDGRQTKSVFYNYLAISLVSQSKPAEAIEALINAYKHDPDNTNALLNLAEIYIQLGQYSSAETILDYVWKSAISDGSKDTRIVASMRERISKSTSELK